MVNVLEGIVAQGFFKGYIAELTRGPHIIPIGISSTFLVSLVVFVVRASGSKKDYATCRYSIALLVDVTRKILPMKLLFTKRFRIKRFNV